jgi:hypothetical protein
MYVYICFLEIYVLFLNFFNKINKINKNIEYFLYYGIIFIGLLFIYLLEND